MPILLSALIIAFPTYFYAWLVRRIDRFEKEPPLYLFLAFLWGALPAVIVALIAQIILAIPTTVFFGDNTLSGQFVSTAITAPVTEEILKGLAVAIIYFTRRKEFDGWVDGVVYGAMAGFGFAYVENILYLMGPTTFEGWVGLFFARVILLGFMHGFWTALIGIGFGLARHMRNPFTKSGVIATGLILAIAAHLIHNGSLVLAEASGGLSILVALANYGFLILLFLVLGVVAAANDRKMMKKYLADEVPDVISPADYASLCNTKANALSRFRMAPQEKRAFIQAAAELAQKKFQLLKMGDEEGNRTEIARMRQELRKLRRV
ncbi:MAG: PrsW family intramembrane metalloprotease [Leptolyngbyaceae cyanobacterium bins.59]|nr:PrsW family intramembrane metalloprotease [Leptolyngbyaceae cyanobacterium bins.59]